MCIRTRLARTLGHNLLVVAVLVSAFLWGMADEARFQVEPYRPPAAGSAADLMASNDCWTGSLDMPPSMVGVIPPRVVVTDGTWVRLSGERMVDRALEQIFEGVDHGLTVHGFCS